jgi:uncharacterized protein YjbJ (UPF0337 family)
MGSNADDAKGRVKEAVGDLTNDKDLEREGKADQVGAEVKDKVSGAVDSVKDAFSKD